MIELSPEAMPNIERTPVDPEQLAAFSRESQFMRLAMDLLIEVGSWTCFAASVMGTSKSWSRDRAAVGGNLVRLYKLIDSVLDQTDRGRDESMMMFARLMFETIVNIRYIIQNYSPALVDDYVKYSLRHERKLRDRIRSNIEARGGIVLPIEDRMIQSIERAAKAGGVSLDDASLLQKGPWGGKNVYDKAEAVGLGQMYLAGFGGTSHGIHGNWHELYSSHLEWDEAESFKPNFSWRRPRPQVHLALCLLVLDTLPIYLDFVIGAAWKDLIGEHLADLDRRIMLTSSAHENYLSAKQWPDT